MPPTRGGADPAVTPKGDARRRSSAVCWWVPTRLIPTERPTPVPDAMPVSDAVAWVPSSTKTTESPSSSSAASDTALPGEWMPSDAAGIAVAGARASSADAGAAAAEGWTPPCTTTTGPSPATLAWSAAAGDAANSSLCPGTSWGWRSTCPPSPPATSCPSDAPPPRRAIPPDPPSSPAGPPSPALAVRARSTTRSSSERPSGSTEGPNSSASTASAATRARMPQPRSHRNRATCSATKAGGGGPLQGEEGAGDESGAGRDERQPTRSPLPPVGGDGIVREGCKGSWSTLQHERAGEGGRGQRARTRLGRRLGCAPQRGQTTVETEWCQWA